MDKAELVLLTGGIYGDPYEAKRIYCPLMQPRAADLIGGSRRIRYVRGVLLITLKSSKRTQSGRHN
jgi:hypothetical protein